MSRRLVKRRSRVFLGCEGESEAAYGALLRMFVENLEDSPALHIDARVLGPGAGDPLSLVQLACNVVKRDEARRKHYFVKAILLDHDRLAAHHDRAQKAVALACRSRVRLIWQSAKHEAFLLRHLPAHLHDDPPADRAEQALKAVWPEYRKPMTAVQLSRRIGPADVARVCTVHDDLAAFLTDIGLLDALRRHHPAD